MRQPANRLAPAVRKLWWITGSLPWLVATAAGVVVALVIEEVPLGAVLAVSGVWLVVVIVLPVYMYRRWRYEIRETDLFVARGAIFYRVTLVPFDRIQYVHTNHGPLDRALGLAQVEVFTAAGQAVQIPGLDEEEAESLREELSRVAGTTSV